MSWNGCPKCQCDVFRLDTEQGHWFGTCDCCGTICEFLPNGMVQLVRIQYLDSFNTRSTRSRNPPPDGG